jgi:hypothetical protein
MHDPNSLEVEFRLCAPELFFQPIDPGFIGGDTARGILQSLHVHVAFSLAAWLLNIWWTAMVRLLEAGRGRPLIWHFPAQA